MGRPLNQASPVFLLQDKLGGSWWARVGYGGELKRVQAQILCFYKVV